LGRVLVDEKVGEEARLLGARAQQTRQSFGIFQKPISA
jgi:hypothetical protein